MYKKKVLSPHVRPRKPRQGAPRSPPGKRAPGPLRTSTGEYPRAATKSVELGWATLSNCRPEGLLQETLCPRGSLLEVLAP